MNRFKGKVVLVTGGNRNTGLWLVKKFADEGARVFMCGSSEASTARGAEALAAMTPQTEKTTRSGGFGLPERTFAAGEALTAGFLAENRGTNDSGDRFWMRFVPVYEGDGTAANTTALLRVSFTVRSARDKTMQTAVSTGDLALPYHTQPN